MLEPGGENHEINVESLAAGGDGVGRLLGKTVFLPGTVPGDRVRCRLLRDHGRWARGEVLELLTAGAERVEPPCPVAGDCGGCQWQQVSAGAQQEARLAIVTGALRRIAGLERWPEIRIDPGEGQLAYRRRAEYRGELLPGGELRFGFFARGSHRIVEHDRCLLLEEPLAAGLAALKARLGERLHRPCSFQVEATLLEGPALQLLIRVETAAAQEMLAALEGLTSPACSDLHISLRALSGPRVFREAAGAPFLLERVSLPVPTGDELRYSLFTRPGDFVQANRSANGELLRHLLRETKPQREDWLLDLYCGAGNFSLPLALAGARVLGVEARRSALRCARKAARQARASRARFRSGSVADLLPLLAEESKHYNKVLLDPPRRGAPELAQYLDALGVEEILALSCHPATLARDIKAWRARGFELRSLQLFDFFPQTYHVEVLARLSRSA